MLYFTAHIHQTNSCAYYDFTPFLAPFVQCTVYNAHSRVYTVQYTLYSVQDTLYNVKRTATAYRLPHQFIGVDLFLNVIVFYNLRHL